ncbi:MAG: hypothetical protein KA419_12620 [Acidobacteria bacterium]|nr:hypothetical protein [Acidobacteriota bacterium]
MSRCCRICGRIRANERFGGKGDRRYICKDCMKTPKAERQRILQRAEILGYLFRQSRISSLNLKRLDVLAASGDAEIAPLAQVVREVGAVRPGRRKRVRFLYYERRDLFDRLARLGVLEEHRDLMSESDFDEFPDFGDPDPFDDGEILRDYYLAAAFQDDTPDSSKAQGVPLFGDEVILREYYGTAPPPVEYLYPLRMKAELEFAFDPDEIPF